MYINKLSQNAIRIVVIINILYFIFQNINRHWSYLQCFYHLSQYLQPLALNTLCSISAFSAAKGFRLGTGASDKEPAFHIEYYFIL